MTIALPGAARGTTRLILLRHGEPDETVHGRCYGRLDPGLSHRGRGQMQAAWAHLRNQPVAAVYSSPSRRAIESASLREVSGAATVDDRLQELDFGEFEGLTYAEISARHPETYVRWMAAPTQVAFPGGESFTAMSARVGAAIDELLTSHAGETVAIVSHGGVNRAVLARALELEPRRIFRLAQDYGCLNVIDYVDDEPLVRLMNLTAAPC